MKTGFEFIQRMRDDAEFRQKVNAYPEGAERLEFLRSEGYDFTPFVRILDNLCVQPQSVDWRQQPGASASPGKATSGFFGLLRRLFGATRVPRPDW